jgi:hypothetical protein
MSALEDTQLKKRKIQDSLVSSNGEVAKNAQTSKIFSPFRV